MTSSQKEKILRENPGCYQCGIGFKEGDEIEYDHVLPLALGGTNELSNFRPMHAMPCHLDKTREDVRMIAKAKRLEAKRKGIKGGGSGRKIPSRPFPKRRRHEGSD